MTLIEAAKLAREALALWKDESPYSWSQADENAVASLDQAIAEAEQQKPVKHSLAVGPKSIQSRVYDKETGELISFVKMPLEEAGLARREWQGLTDEEIDTWNIVGHESLREFVRAIEAKLKEKNHD